MMLGKAYNFQLGYLFKNNFSIDGRYTHLIADQNSFLNNATFYNRPNYYTLGITKLSRRNYGFKVQGSITYVDGSLGINHDNFVSEKELVLNNEVEKVINFLQEKKFIYNDIFQNNKLNRRQNQDFSLEYWYSTETNNDYFDFKTY